MVMSVFEKDPGFTGYGQPVIIFWYQSLALLKRLVCLMLNWD